MHSINFLVTYLFTYLPEAIRTENSDADRQMKQGY